jgi:phage virion morphogenesis protein
MITIEIKDDAIAAALARIAAALTDLKPVMRDIGESLIESTKIRFVQGVDPDGSPWAPKSPTTIETYRARGDSVGFRPLIGPTRTLSTTIHYIAGSSQVEVGSSRIQAAVMQQGAAKGAFGRTSRGAPIPWGAIPARPFLGLSDEDRAALADLVAKWLDGAATGS